MAPAPRRIDLTERLLGLKEDIAVNRVGLFVVGFGLLVVTGAAGLGWAQSEAPREDHSEPESSETTRPLREPRHMGSMVMPRIGDMEHMISVCAQMMGSSGVRPSAPGAR